MPVVEELVRYPFTEAVRSKVCCIRVEWMVWNSRADLDNQVVLEGNIVVYCLLRG
jgi:hypothetical protein